MTTARACVRPCAPNRSEALTWIMKPVRDMELGSFVCSNSGAYILILGGETFLNMPFAMKNASSDLWVFCIQSLRHWQLGSGVMHETRWWWLQRMCSTIFRMELGSFCSNISWSTGASKWNEWNHLLKRNGIFMWHCFHGYHVDYVISCVTMQPFRSNPYPYTL